MDQQIGSGKRLDGKVAIITGATGGIGEATAKRFLEEGASVMLVGRSAEKLAATRNNLADFGNLATSVADAADENAMAAAVTATVDAFGGVDILLANAGTEGKIALIEDQTVENFEEVFRTNVIGVWLSMKYCVEPMKKRGRGSMIAYGWRAPDPDRALRGPTWCDALVDAPGGHRADAAQDDGSRQTHAGSAREVVAEGCRRTEEPATEIHRRENSRSGGETQRHHDESRIRRAADADRGRQDGQQRPRRRNI